MDNNDLQNLDIWAVERRAQQLRADATARGARTALKWVKTRIHLTDGSVRNA